MLRIANVRMTANKLPTFHFEQKFCFYLMENMVHNGQVSTYYPLMHKCTVADLPCSLKKKHHIPSFVELDEKNARHYPTVSVDNYHNSFIQETREDNISTIIKLTKLESNISLLISSLEEDLDLAINNIHKQLAKVKNQRSLLLLRNLHLRFRITVRKVVEPLLSEKIREIVEKYKGGNLVANFMNKNRDVDYSFFLEQLDKDIKKGNLIPFFHQHGIESPVEFFEACKYALEGDKESFPIACPDSIYYIEEEISNEIEFPDPFDKDLILEAIENVSSEITQLQCSRIVFYLSKLPVSN